MLACWAFLLGVVVASAKRDDPSILGPLGGGPPPAKTPKAPKAPPNPLDSFSGDIFYRDQGDYDEWAYQYATTSMDAGTMRPAIILFPNNDDDIKKAIQYANQNNVAIAVRTGGHQYSGASSTSGDNIQIDLSRFSFAFNWTEATGLLRVGVSWALKDLDAKMGSLGLFVPHGDCSHVHVGGHTHSGGYGNLCRGFGLFGDHVMSVEIITADGRSQTLTRGVGGPAEKDLFWAVLGGSPGNYGIVTHVTLRPHRNANHPDSRGFKVVYLYNRALMEGLLNVLVEMISNDTLPADFDVIITLTSGGNLIDMGYVGLDAQMFAALGLMDNANFPPSINVFAEWANLVPGQQYDPTWFNKFDAAATAANAVTLQRAIDPGHYTPMTNLSAAWVFGNVREYMMPYKKRTQLSNSMTLAQDGFAKWMADHIDEIQSHPEKGVHLLGQFQVVGGQYSKYKLQDTGETSYSWRQDSRAVYTLDTFYEENTDLPKQTAVAFQAGSQTSIGPGGKFCTQDRRVLWGSFGDDHNFGNVWPFYHETQQKYDKLVRIKNQVDPKKIFTPNAFAVGVRGDAAGPLPSPAALLVRDEEFAPRLRARRDAVLHV